MGESVPNRFNPMGFDIINGRSSASNENTVNIPNDHEGCIVYANNDGTGSVICSDMYMPDETIGEECDGLSLVVYSNGDANNIYIDNGGIMYVLDGGYADATMIHSGGTMIVSSGGSGTYIDVYDYGTLIVKSGGLVEEVWIANNEANTTITVENGGTISYYSG